jgi:Xaa-Pro aminopeptidase
MSHSDKLFTVRSQMAMMGVDAVIVLSSDQHLSEYIADYWKFREYLSGFNGSAGTLVITMDEAGLWTDSRYFLQAEEQLGNSGISLFRMGEPGVPEYRDFLAEVLQPGNVVGLDGRTMSVADFKVLSSTMRKKDIRVDSRFFLADEIWFDRHPIPGDDVFELEQEYTGLTRREKTNLVNEMMRSKGVSHYVVCALDEIAWMLNLRGSDVDYNPVFHAFMIISQNHINLFIDPHKITAAVGKRLEEDNIKVFHYGDFYKFVKEMPPHSEIYYDPQRTNYQCINNAPQSTVKVEGLGFITELKSVKNSAEIEGSRLAHINDGVAMVQFLMWLEENIGHIEISEISCADKLRSLRENQPLFIGESFGCIAGYGSNGAIVHYTATEESNATLKPEGLLLLDSGGQYRNGTTDITRTIALGKLTRQQMTDYTLVLKGHIGIAMAIFPEGTRGVHLDILARQHLWNNGLNYGHGTGHGIGAFLNVHEGPQSIRPQDNGITLKTGMITSNEPGLYRTGEHGIRIENLILCKEKTVTQFGRFFEFETLTLCPIDTRPIVKDMLGSEEILWLNNYHKMVFDKLEPKLNEKEKAWLKKATASI